jgi:hypothetical protein
MFTIYAVFSRYGPPILLEDYVDKSVSDLTARISDEMRALLVEARDWYCIPDF